MPPHQAFGVLVLRSSSLSIFYLGSLERSGSGAGGETFAFRLARSGKRILRIERGPYIPREKDNRNSSAVNAKGKYAAKDNLRDNDGKEITGTRIVVLGETRSFTARRFSGFAKPTLARREKGIQLAPLRRQHASRRPKALHPARSGR